MKLFFVVVFITIVLWIGASEARPHRHTHNGGGYYGGTNTGYGNNGYSNGYGNNGYGNNGYGNNGYGNNGYGNNGYANNGYANNGYANNGQTNMYRHGNGHTYYPNENPDVLAPQAKAQGGGAGNGLVDDLLKTLL